MEKMSETSGREGFAAVLLAGGESSRMGRDKAWLAWEGEPLWRLQLEKLKALRPGRLLLACREEQGMMVEEGVERLLDDPGKLGPLPVLERCLMEVNMPLLTLAVDMPAMTAEVLEGILNIGMGTERGVVFHGGHGHEPLAALYFPAVLPFLRGRRRLQEMTRAAVAAGVLAERPLPAAWTGCFMNVNSPEDWSCLPPNPSR